MKNGILNWLPISKKARSFSGKKKLSGAAGTADISTLEQKHQPNVPPVIIPRHILNCSLKTGKRSFANGNAEFPTLEIPLFCYFYRKRDRSTG
jgi:hypothetical protein